MSTEAVKQAIQKLAGTYLKDEVYLQICEVTAVDEDANTCTLVPVSGPSEAEIPNVTLAASVADGLLLTPKIGSEVVALISKQAAPLVIQYSDLDKADIIVGRRRVYVTEDTVSINDGSFGGVIKVAELVQRLNTLETLYNTLVTAFNTHVHPVSGANTTPPTVPFTQSATQTTREQIENTTFVHGE